MKKVLIGVITALVIILALMGVTAGFQLFRIDITLNGEESVVAEYGETYEDQGAKVEKVAILFPFIRKEYPYETVNGVDVNNLGTYDFTYRAEFNGKKFEKIRKVEVKDNAPPVITLVSDPDFYTLPGHEYIEEGYSAVDKYDGDVTENVERTDDGERVTYRVSDSFGNKAELVREIVFDDRKGPEITFDDVAFIQQGSSFDSWYHAEDDLDGDVTDRVEVIGEVDTDTAGEYTIKYIVSDSYNNVTVAERTVQVCAYDPDKVIYMTFDDGPSRNTDRLLDILKKYNIKATFFVTDVFDAYEYCIKREYEEGHTVAVHSYTHNYARIYQSPEAYWNDFNLMNDVIEEQTGHRATLFRFPGGSSNTVSFNYCDGIMSTLAAQSRQKGLTYFDWNVESGDAGRTTDPWEVAQNLIDGVQWHNRSVCLSHDSLEYTVDGIERFFRWALENGYTFLPLDENSPTAHHGIAN